MHKSASKATQIFADTNLLQQLQDLVLAAGSAIMQVYQQADFCIKQKQDNSPVTQADLAAHHILAAGLAKLTPHIPIVSEEDVASLSVPNEHSQFWLIDPLDGTKEFINRNGEFTVNLALIDDHATRFGLVSTPVNQTIYWGGMGLGGWRSYQGKVTQLHTQDNANPMRVVASKSHLNAETKGFIDRLGNVALVQAGSSLKFLRIAEGLADYYPRMAPTCEWDTAAAQAILEGAGGSVTQVNGSPIRYGKTNILNPHFIAKNS